VLSETDTAPASAATRIVINVRRRLVIKGLQIMGAKWPRGAVQPRLLEFVFSNILFVGRKPAKVRPLARENGARASPGQGRSFD